jgi:co-chaperonin GroES (HSP10)
MESPISVDPTGQGIDVSDFELDQLFPKIDPQFKPYGARVLVQLRRVVNESKGGIILSVETKRTEAWNLQVGKIIDMGDSAFKNRATGEPWPEGAWAKIGDYVRVPRHGGDRIIIPDDKGEKIVVLILSDYDLLGKYTGDPRKVTAFIE